ncbi:reverse transcriptase domain-containing protein [Tanacetum coccineum]
MHTRTSNSKLIEPLPEPERTLNRRLRQQNRKVPFERRHELPQHPRIVYVPILDINYFRHFVELLNNYDTMDDELMWAADRVVSPTTGFAITLPATANEFAIKDTENEVVRLMMFPLSLTREAKTWLDELNEGTIKNWNELHTLFISRFFPSALFDRLLGEIRAFSQNENETLTDTWLRMKELLRNCQGHNVSKGNIIKIFYHGLSETTQKALNAAAGGIFLYKTPNQAYQLLEDKVLLKLYWAKNQKSKPLKELSLSSMKAPEKIHFMVKEGIVLGHKVSEAGLEDDKAKVDVISKLPPLLILKLLKKDTPFEFNNECHNAFESLKEKLTCALVIVSLNWNLPFELMCDASDFAIGAVLGQKDGKNFHPIYFASKTLNAAQQNYTVTEKELMVVILLLQEFDGEIKDKKAAADHLSRIENDEISDDSEVDENFPGETLMEINTEKEPWFADFANYLVSKIIPKGMTYQQKNKFFSDLKYYFGKNPTYLEYVLTDRQHDIWSRKLDDALCAFRTAFKTPTGTTPYKLIYGKNCHLPFEIEHRAYWALKNCNPDLIAAGEKKMLQLRELDELRHQAYENSRLYKARTKVWHDRKLKMRKEFKHGNKVLLFHSKYKFKWPKLRSCWLGPYVVKHQYQSSYVELYGKDGKTFIVNGHRLKLYHEKEEYNDTREAITPFYPKE